MEAVNFFWGSPKKITKKSFLFSHDSKNKYSHMKVHYMFYVHMHLSDRCKKASKLHALARV
jgi:hypothetical protein